LRSLALRYLSAYAGVSNLTNNASQGSGRRVKTGPAADYIGVAESTLEKDRVTGLLRVPYIKIGRTVVYDTADLDAYLAARRRHSTSEAA
jgi:hypothetical protein